MLKPARFSQDTSFLECHDLEFPKIRKRIRCNGFNLRRHYNSTARTGHGRDIQLPDGKGALIQCHRFPELERRRKRDDRSASRLTKEKKYPVNNKNFAWGQRA
jgi:hypothetical protein